MKNFMDHKKVCSQCGSDKVAEAYSKVRYQMMNDEMRDVEEYDSMCNEINGNDYEYLEDHDWCFECEDNCVVREVYALSDVAEGDFVLVNKVKPGMIVEREDVCEFDGRKYGKLFVLCDGKVREDMYSVEVLDMNNPQYNYVGVV